MRMLSSITSTEYAQDAQARRGHEHRSEMDVRVSAHLWLGFKVFIGVNGMKTDPSDHECGQRRPGVRRGEGKAQSLHADLEDFDFRDIDLMEDTRE